MVEVTAAEQNIEKRKKWRQPKRPRDNIKHVNICIIGDLEGEKRKKAHEKIFEEILAENVLNMGKEIVNQVQEAQSIPGRINPRRLRHTVI